MPLGQPQAAPGAAPGRVFAQQICNVTRAAAWAVPGAAPENVEPLAVCWRDKCVIVALRT